MPRLEANKADVYVQRTIYQRDEVWEIMQGCQQTRHKGICLRQHIFSRVTDATPNEHGHFWEQAYGTDQPDTSKERHSYC